MSFLDTVYTRLNDSLNPILVKELRRLARGKLLISVLIVFLFIQLGIFVNFMPFNCGNAFSFEREARSNFFILVDVLFLFSGILVPLYSGYYLAAKHSEYESELESITALTPQEIIRGNLLAGFVVVVLLHCASLPFLMAIYQFRGIELLSLCFVFILTLLTSAVNIALLMYLVCRFRDYVAWILTGTAFLLLTFFLFSLPLPASGSIELLQVDIGAEITTWCGCLNFALIVAVLLACLGGLYEQTAKRLAPSSIAKRAFPSKRRMFTVILWGIFLIVVVFPILWNILMTILWCFSVIIRRFGL